MDITKKKDSKTKRFVTVLIDIKCLNCGITFHPRFAKTKYCSKQCSNIASIKLNNCIECGNETKNKKYCSHECYSINLIKDKIKKECKNCKCIFEVNQSNDYIQYCSRECSNIGLSGSGNYKWIEDRSLLKKSDRIRSTAYNEWRDSVYERDNWRCKLENEYCEGRIEAHHIMTWKDFPELRYDINNGITLCHHHHHPRKEKDVNNMAEKFKEIIK